MLDDISSLVKFFEPPTTSHLQSDIFFSNLTALPSSPGFISPSCRYMTRLTRGKSRLMVALDTRLSVVTSAKASFEHHWNNHQFCGPWCQAKDWTDEEKETNKNMFRNKETHQKEYNQQFGVHSKYTEEDRLRRVFHEWTTNKTEQIHSLVTNVFLPKRSYYCRTICGRARTYLAVSIDSIGYYEYNRRLYLELGLQMTTITAVFYKQQDKRRQTDRAYANKPERRKLRAEHRLENINEEWRREVIDKQTGNTYRSGIAVTSQTTKSSSEKQSSSKGPVVDGAGGFKKMRTIDRFVRLAKIMDISVDQAGCVQRTRKAITMKVRPFDSTY
jgi:hypothetical protein